MKRWRRRKKGNKPLASSSASPFLFMMAIAIIKSAYDLFVLQNELRKKQWKRKRSWSEAYTNTIHEETVKNTAGVLQWHWQRKLSQEPWKASNGELKLVVLDMSGKGDGSIFAGSSSKKRKQQHVLGQDGHELFNEPLKNMLVHYGAHHVGGIVAGQHPIADWAQGIKGLLLTQKEEENGCEQIHRLAIANLWRLERIGIEHAAEPWDSLFVLEGGMLRQTSLQVLFNFLNGERLKALVRLEEVLVIAWSKATFVNGPRTTWDEQGFMIRVPRKTKKKESGASTWSPTFRCEVGSEFRASQACGTCSFGPFASLSQSPQSTWATPFPLSALWF